MRPAWSPRQPVQHHTHQGNVCAFIRDLVPYFGTRKRYGLKNLRKKKWDKKKKKNRKCDQMEEPGCPRKEPKLDSRWPRELVHSLHATPNLGSVSWFSLL